MCTLAAYIQFNKPCAKLIYFVKNSKVYGGQFFGFYIKFKEASQLECSIN